MRLDETIHLHIAKLPEHLQAEVFDFVLFLEQKQKRELQNGLPDETAALAIHQQLMEQYSSAFEKLAQ